MAATACCLTLQASTNRPSGEAGKNWRRRWRTAPQSGCVGRVVVVPRSKKKDPAIVPALQELVEPETAGDPMSEQQWVRSSLRQLSTRLCDAGHPVSPPTVGRLLDDLG